MKSYLIDAVVLGFSKKLFGKSLQAQTEDTNSQSRSPVPEASLVAGHKNVYIKKAKINNNCRELTSHDKYIAGKLEVYLSGCSAAASNAKP